MISKKTGHIETAENTFVIDSLVARQSDDYESNLQYSQHTLLIVISSLICTHYAT